MHWSRSHLESPPTPQRRAVFTMGRLLWKAAEVKTALIHGNRLCKGTVVMGLHPSVNFKRGAPATRGESSLKLDVP